MINLLPSQEKNELLLEERKKLIVIWGIIFTASLSFLILLLLFIQTYLFYELSVQKIILEKTKKEYEYSEAKNLQDIIKTYNENLSKLKNFYIEKIYWTRSIEKLSKISRPGIYLTSLVLEKENNKTKLNLSGFSKSRDNLSQFKTNLEKESDFEEIYFSPSSWIKPTNIDFYLSFKIENENKK